MVFLQLYIGAILSSFNSALNSSVTLFGLGIYKEYVNKDADEQTIVKAGKKFGTVLAVVSMCIAPLLIYASDGLFAYLQEVNGIYSIPILTIIVVGYMTKYVPAIAAKIGIISGSVLYIISQFIIKPYVIGKDDYPHFLHFSSHKGGDATPAAPPCGSSFHHSARPDQKQRLVHPNYEVQAPLPPLSRVYRSFVCPYNLNC